MSNNENLTVVLGISLLAAAFSANAVTIAASDSGWYNDAGTHDSTNENYIAGLCSDCGGPTFRNFFVLDMSSVGAVSSATLRVDTATVETDGTYTLFDVSTAVPTLTASGFGLTGIYADLGTGTSYASTSILSSQDNDIIEISLNASVLASISAATGLWALGGSFASPLSTFFGSTGALLLEIVITEASVPAPAGVLFVIAGLVGLSAPRARS